VVYPEDGGDAEMSTAFRVLRYELKLIENELRETANVWGVKIRKRRISGIDAIFPDGRKEHYHGWKHMYNEWQMKETFPTWR